MKQTTRNWIDKAEGDRQVAIQQLDSPAPVFDAVCFHAQQCAEKYLKAYLQEHEVPYPRIHDLDALAALIEPRVPDLAALRLDLASLSSYAVDIRYPGVVAGREEAEENLRIANAARSTIRAALGLPT